MVRSSFSVLLIPWFARDSIQRCTTDGFLFDGWRKNRLENRMVTALVAERVGFEAVHHNQLLFQL
jgi:hypothetical protein